MATDIDAVHPPGSAKDAVVASTLYRRGQHSRTINLNEVSSCLPLNDDFLWIGLQDPPSDLLESLCIDLGLTPRAIEEIIAPHRRPKAIEYEEATLVVAITLRTQAQRPKFGDTQLVIGLGFLLTIRRGSSASYKEVRDELEATPALLYRGADYVAMAVLDLITDHYVEIMAEMERLVENTEHQLLLRGFRDANIRLMYRYRRDLLRIHTAIAPMAEVCRKLSRVVMPNIDNESRIYFGETADRMLRVNEQVGSLREALAFAFEASLMIGQAQQTETTRKLAAWAAILAVPTAIAGIYGMNFRVMPELNWAYGYPAVLGVTLSICGLLFWRFKRVKWL